MNKILGTLCALVSSAALVTQDAPASATATAPAPVAIQPTKLDAGPAVKGPRLQGNVVVDGDVSVPVPGKRVVLLGAAGQGYVVVVRRQGIWATLRVAPDRDPKTLALKTTPDEVVLADDGATIAVTASQDGGSTRFVVRSARSGKRIESETFGGFPRVLDLDQNLAIIGGFDSGAISWDYSTDLTAAITGKPTYAADISSDRLAYFTKDPYNGGCSVVSMITAPDKRLWKSCGERIEDFNNSGNRIATVHILSDGLGPNRVWERTVSGTLLASYTVGYYFGAIEWETNTDLLLDAYGPKKWATVRVSEGDAERASELRPTPEL